MLSTQAAHFRLVCLLTAVDHTPSVQLLQLVALVVLAIQELVDHFLRHKRHVVALLRQHVDDKLARAAAVRRDERVHELACLAAAQPSGMLTAAAATRLPPLTPSR